MPQQLPLIPSLGNQRFQTELDGITYIFDVRWNARSEAWFFDLLTEDEQRIMSGMKIVLGTLIGLRSTHPNRPSGRFIVADLSGEGRDAGYDDLGVRVIMLFYTLEELNAL